STGIKWIDNVDLSEYNKGPQSLSGSNYSELTKLLGAYEDNGEVKMIETGIHIRYHPVYDIIYFNYDRIRTNPADGTPKKQWGILTYQSNSTYNDRFSIFSNGGTDRYHLDIVVDQGDQVRFSYGIGTRYFGNRYNRTHNGGWEVELIGTDQPTTGQFLR